MSTTTLEKRVEEQMRLAFDQHQWRQFPLTSFVDAGLGDEASVLGVFRALQREHKIQIVVEMKCGDGHTVWSGHWDGVHGTQRIHACQRCDDPTSLGDSHMLVRAELAPNWIRRFEAKLPEKDKKKESNPRSRQR